MSNRPTQHGVASQSTIEGNQEDREELSLSSMSSYESFIARADVEADTEECDTATQTPKERFKSAVHKCIALTKLKAILEEQSSNNNVPEQSLDELETEHPRNAGRFTVLGFVNSGSGGGVGKIIYKDLVSYLGEEYVFDLKSCKKGNMPEDTLLKFAYDPFVRVLACGGDGTAGWIESSMDKVWKKVLGANVAVQDTKFSQYLPLAIMPLGTGNDLSRQYHWGGRFKPKMKSPQMIQNVEDAKPASLDRWKCVILPIERLDDEARAWLPKMLGDEKAVRSKDQANNVKMLEKLFAEEDGGDLSQHESLQLSLFFDGVFCNYFSIGFDANIAFQFHKEREEHPERFTSPIKNKIVYVQKSPVALTSPFLYDKVRVMVNNIVTDEIEELKIPRDCRALVLLNIQSYAGGNKLTNTGKPDDGLIEVVFVSNIARVGAAQAVPLLLFRAAAQTDMVCIRTKRALHCQVDGEPWLQSQAIVRVTHHSRNALLKKTKAPTAWSCASKTPTVN